MNSKIRMRIVKGFIAIGAFILFDYLLINELILSSNATPLVAMISAAIFCAGLDGAPTFAGLGLDMLIKMRKMQTTSGRIKAIVFLTVGVTCSIAAFIMLFIIRRDTIMASGGFAARYDGLYGDMILTIAPYITSALAFAIGIWMSPNAIELQEQIVEQKEEEEKLAHVEKENAFNSCSNALATSWANIFPEADIPNDLQYALYAMRRETITQLPDRFKLLLPQLLDETNLVTPFTNSFKEILINREVVKDPKYVACAETSYFQGDSDIGVARDSLRSKLKDVSTQIIEAVSYKKGGAVDYVRVT